VCNYNNSLFFFRQRYSIPDAPFFLISLGEEIPLRLDIWTGSSVTRRENTYDKEIGAQMIAERRPEI
jgi:hypothetical protein